MEKRMRVPFIAILTALLCFALAFGLCFGLAKADGDTPETPVKLSSVDDFVIDEMGKLTGLSETGGAKVSDNWWLGEFDRYFELIIPANVTQVSTAEFRYNDKLVKVSFAEGSECKLIQQGRRYNVFEGSTSLREVDFTNATKLIALGNSLFAECTSLSKVTFAEALADNADMSIGGFTFKNTALTSFEIPAYVTSINMSAFKQCGSLKTLTVADGNPKYTYYTDASGDRYDQAVYEKDADGKITALAVAPSAMTGITIPKAVLDVNYVPEEDETEETTTANIAEAVAEKAYALCGAVEFIDDLETIAIEQNDELYAYGNCLFVKDGSKLTSETLSSSADYFPQAGNDMFIAPFSVKEVTLPAEFSCKPDDIDDGGYPSSYFWYYFSESLTENVPWDNPMTKLKAINVDAGNTVFESIGGALYTKGDHTKFWIPCAATSFTVPAGMTDDFSSISAKLSGNKLLREIKVEEGNTVYTAVGGALFKKDYSDYYIPIAATSFTVPAGMTSIDFSVFTEKLSGNKLLREIKVEEGNPEYISFEDSLFAKNSPDAYIPYAATSVTIPKEVTQFDGSALVNHPYLTSVNIQEGHQYYDSVNGVIYDKAKTILIYAPSTITEFYVPATLEQIAENAFAVYDGDKRVANKIKNVYVEDLEAWSKIKFGNPIETAEQYEQNPDGSLSAERRRTVASDLIDGYGANPMSGGADMYVKKGGRWELLENLVLDFDGEISDLAFAGCKSLRTVTVGNKVTRIGEMSFAMCKNIRSISLPYVGCTRNYSSIYTNACYMGSAYAYEVFGGRGAYSSGTFGYSLAPETIDTITVTGYNILEKAICGDGYVDGSDYKSYPVYLVPDSAFSGAPVRKIVIDIDETDGHEITLGARLFIGSSVSEVDLKNSKATASQTSFLSNSATESFIEKLTVPGTLKVIADRFFFVFANINSSLEEVIIPDGVEYIGYSMFGNLDTLTLPKSIGGINSIFGVKTVYLTGWTDRTDQGYVLSSLISLGDEDTGAHAIYVAIDSEAYAALPDVAKDSVIDYPLNTSNHVFYQADVVFRVKDSTGKLLAETTEKHLAAQGQYSKPYIKWAQKQGARGDVYWAIDENYALPDTVGSYKVDSTKWTLDGVAVTKDTCLKGNTAQYVIEQTLPADANIQLTPQNVIKQYDGTAWTLPDGMQIESISVDAGGNGYSSYRGMPVDVGTYTVKAKCKTGYSWYDDPSASTETVRSFTLQITPYTATAEWFYSPDGSSAGQNVTGTVPERMYDGNSPHRWFYVEFTDVSGKKRRADFTTLALYASGDRSTPVYSMTDVGSYEIAVGGSGKTTDDVVWLGNYAFENSLQFAVVPRVIDLNDYANLSWGLDAYGSLLRDGDIYMYDGVPYAYAQPTLGEPDSTLHVLGSVVRLRSADNHKIVINNIPALLAGSGAQYTAVYSGNTADGVGKYTATAALTVSDPNYVFGYGLGSDLTSRGMTITINPDGTATIDKVWYVVAIDNGMLNADGAEYKIDGWTFGDDVTVVAPRLEHGDEDESSYLSNGKVLFTLARNGETLANGFGRNVFGYYINKSMPAGRYELVCVVSDVTVGNHTHWWNNEVHDGADADVLYHGFTRTLVFEIQAADIGFTLSAPTEEGYASYEWELNGNKETFFSEFEAAVNAVGKVVLVSVDPQGYWSEHKEYYGGYSLSYNFARMSNNTYLSATDGNLQKYIDGGAKGTYSVYFQITAPNHAPLTDMGNGRYSYFFTVVVFETVDPVDIHVENVTYTGVKNIPALSETDIYHVVLDETDNYIDGGEHTLYLVLNDSVHYRWKGVAAGEAGLSVKYTITKALNEFIEAPDIVRWIEGKFNEEENGFIGAAKFGNISYVITDTNDNVIFDLSQGIDNRASMKAGTYILKATVAGNDNYSGLSEAFTIRILEKVGLPWWATLLIALGALAVAAVIIFILWKKGVFQILTEKIVVAIRTRASVDATIASVRAAKKEDEAKKTVAAAEARERAEARRAAAKAEREKPAEERAAALEAKAQAQAERAEKMRLRAEALQARAARLRGAEQTAAEEPTEEAAATEAEAAATEETPTDE